MVLARGEPQSNATPQVNLSFRWESMDKKLKKLKNDLIRMEKVLVAYSGGCDSTFLLKVAKDILGRENVLAVTADSPTYPSSEKKDAKILVKKIGARHMFIRTQESEDNRFSQNPKERCY